MKYNFEIVDYSIDNLIEILSQKSFAPKLLIKQKDNIRYFESYFRDIGAQSILIEKEYIDLDYMQDYAAFYVKCFSDYGSKCTRLHFFSIKISKKNILNFLGNKGNKTGLANLENSYLGFIVIKPLPKTIIGRTCLKTYDSDNNRRKFAGLREYYPSLFGISLKIRTLAFQEQDSVTAACATSALWSVFQGTGMIFQHCIPSPVDITLMATDYPDENVPNTLPNKGLTPRQILWAIRELKLEPLKVDGQSCFLLCSAAYAYLNAKIPLVMTVKLVDISNKPYSTIGYHAVALTGYSLGLSKPKPILKGSHIFYAKSSRINKLYVHDDQIGPFSRMILNDTTLRYRENSNFNITSYYLETSWRGKNNKAGSIIAIPDILIIPLYSKIRISFDFIIGILSQFDHVIKATLRNSKSKVNITFQWDLTLIWINDLKSNYLSDNSIPSDEKLKILTRPLPRFIWRSIAISGSDPVFELLFDATDFEGGNFFLCAVGHDNIKYALVKIVAANLASNHYLQQFPLWKILEWFSKNI